MPVLVSVMNLENAHTNLLSSLRAFVFSTLLALGMLWCPGAAVAQDEFALDVLTEKIMDMYVAALPELMDLKEAEWPVSDPDHIEYWEAMAEILKARGFKDYEEFVVLAATISTLVTGIDAMTLEFTEPRQVMEENIGFLQQMIAEVRADPAVQAAMKGAEGDPPVLLPLLAMLAELEEGRALLPEKTDPQNIELIKKYFPKIVRLSNPRADEE